MTKKILLVLGLLAVVVPVTQVEPLGLKTKIALSGVGVAAGVTGAVVCYKSMKNYQRILQDEVALLGLTEEEVALLEKKELWCKIGLGACSVGAVASGIFCGKYVYDLYKGDVVSSQGGSDGNPGGAKVGEIFKFKDSCRAVYYKKSGSIDLIFGDRKNVRFQVGRVCEFLRENPLRNSFFDLIFSEIKSLPGVSEKIRTIDPSAFRRAMEAVILKPTLRDGETKIIGLATAKAFVSSEGYRNVFLRDFRTAGLVSGSYIDDLEE